MNQYLVEVRLPSPLTEEFVALIPEHRAYVNRLMQKGKITSYTLALDRSRVWATFIASSNGEVKDFLALSPLSKFMKIEVFELAFYEHASSRMPHFSLN